MLPAQEIIQDTYYPEAYTEHIRDITLSKDELYSEVALKINVAIEEVETVMEGFIDHFLRQMKLK